MKGYLPLWYKPKLFLLLKLEQKSNKIRAIIIVKNIVVALLVFVLIKFDLININVLLDIERKI